MLTLAARGEPVWQRLMTVIERRNHEIVSCLSPAEQEQLDRLLDRLVHHAREAADVVGSLEE